MRKLGFIGFGNMASAIAGGILSKDVLGPGDMMIYDLDPAKTAVLAEKGIHIAQDALQVARDCDFVLLAVKPQNFPELLPRIKGVAKSSTVFISIAAGISAKAIQAELGDDTKVVVVMPNTPILVGSGTAALSYVSPATAEDFAFVLSLFKAAGEACEIPNNLMNEVISLNGSSPAFIYYIAKIFVDKAVEQGFERETANKLFCTTLIGAAQMMLTTGKDHQQLIDMVTSKGGTTIKGLDTMKENGLGEALLAGIDACTKRAYELGN